MKLPGPVKGIEQEKVDFECQATGIPHPFYTWVDFEGRDATEKDGYIETRLIFFKNKTVELNVKSL